MTNSEAKATPRPWKVASSGNDVRIYNDEKFVSFLDSEDNASLIVKAVNNHEDALEAIRQGIAYLEAIKQGKKVDIQYVQGKMREVLFNASSNEHNPINWEV